MRQRKAPLDPAAIARKALEKPMHDAITYILADATREDIQRIVHAIRSRQSMLADLARAELNVGDTVTFDPGRGRTPVTGKIVRFNRKRVVVFDAARAANWRVHPQLLSRVEAPVARRPRR